MSGLNEGGGLALLTGEVGTGKTTTLRALLERLPEGSDVAMILNPTLDASGLLEAICDDLSVSYARDGGLKSRYDALYQRLIDNHASGRLTVLLIDEAQHLAPEVLEQLRLLTNIETDSQKLLRVILIGQPELQQLLRQPRLRQLAQRITARYHLLPLAGNEVADYIHYRLNQAGGSATLFSPGAVKTIAAKTGGIPRLINRVCDTALSELARQGGGVVSRKLALAACQDVMDWDAVPGKKNAVGIWLGLGAGITLAAGLYFALPNLIPRANEPAPVEQAKVSVPAQPVAIAEPREEPEKPVVKRPALVDVIKPLAQQSRSAAGAMKTLYALWGYEVDTVDASCESAGRAELACYRKTLPLERLATLNRPALVELSLPGEIPFYAVLYRLGSKSAQILMGGKRIEVPRSWLAEHLREEALLLWQPPYRLQTLKAGQKGEAVQWLDSRLQLASGENNPVENNFELAVKSRVEAFQSRMNLKADGIAGPMTLMTLQAMVGQHGPVLFGSEEPVDAMPGTDIGEGKDVPPVR